MRRSADITLYCSHHSTNRRLAQLSVKRRFHFCQYIWLLTFQYLFNQSNKCRKAILLRTSQQFFSNFKKVILATRSLKPPCYLKSWAIPIMLSQDFSLKYRKSLWPSKWAAQIKKITTDYSACANWYIGSVLKYQNCTFPVRDLIIAVIVVVSFNCSC